MKYVTGTVRWTIRFIGAAPGFVRARGPGMGAGFFIASSASVRFAFGLSFRAPRRTPITVCGVPVCAARRTPVSSSPRPPAGHDGPRIGIARGRVHMCTHVHVHGPARVLTTVRVCTGVCMLPLFTHSSHIRACIRPGARACNPCHVPPRPPCQTASRCVQSLASTSDLPLGPSPAQRRAPER